MILQLRDRFRWHHPLLSRQDQDYPALFGEGSSVFQAHAVQGVAFGREGKRVKSIASSMAFLDNPGLKDHEIPGSQTDTLRRSQL